MDEKIVVIETIRKRIQRRLDKFGNKLGQILGEKFKFIVAGNSLNKDIPNDFDLYAIGNEEFDFDKLKGKADEIIMETKNALTVRIDNTVVQFCKYKKDTLKDLVDSFDFAHIQLGAQCEVRQSIENFFVAVEKVYVSSNWEKAKLLETTFYTEPDLNDSYPMSSLIRAFKYKERGNFGDGSYIACVFAILNQFLRRGFDSYDDFKDQLAAVDLAMLNENEGNTAWELYNTCVIHNLVKDPTRHNDSATEDQDIGIFEDLFGDDNE